MAKFLIDEKLAQSILNYLAERPYNQVVLMVQGLTRLEKHEPPKVEEPKERPDDPA